MPPPLTSQSVPLKLLRSGHLNLNSVVYPCFESFNLPILVSTRPTAFVCRTEFGGSTTGRGYGATPG